ncbi:MAG: hypothetical protein A2Y38_20765 [Spirochaetes bacterium GWB1_59_5]|nr:MAG: hypothetical protein A2Y38_20765 [Spirochaetes bacterium GWB1_59_5]
METKDKGQIVYYYNRERRLENAPAGARFALERQRARRPGFMRALVATRALANLFFALVFMLVAVLVVGYVQGTRNEGSVDGNTVTASAMWFEGHVYVTIKRSTSWLDRFKAVKPSMLEIRTGAGAEYSTGIMQAAEAEVRLRFQAETKPSRIAVIASVPGPGGETLDSVELIVLVE